MQITELRLTNFRNYTLQKFSFSPVKNIIIGNNGTGKTNIVEAIYYLSITKSFRNIDDNFLIKDSEKSAIIEGKIKNRSLSNYKIIIDTSGKKVFIDNNQIRKISDYISKISVVLFHPDDIKLIKDNPGIHRKLINMELSVLNNDYLKLLSLYNKILKQRNMYLKSMQINGNIPKDYLDVLTTKLIEYGFKIYDFRNEFIDSINNYLSVNYNKITKKEKLWIKYNSDFNNCSKEILKQKYDKYFKKDLNYGKTNFGVHLDDYIFYFNEKLAKDYLSEGEQRNAIISFKLAEVNVFYEKKGIMPILILDDLFSELDQEKITKIIKFFKKNIQIFITTTDIDNISEKILKNSKVFKLKNNKVEEKIYE